MCSKTKIRNKSELCQTGERGIGQVVASRIYCASGSGKMVVTSKSHPKMTGKLLVCVDYQKLNAAAILDPIPLPLTIQF